MSLAAGSRIYWRTPMSRRRKMSPDRKFKPGPAMRKEKDSIGEFGVPAGAYWGINTGRAAENFPISGRKINPRLIAAYCHIKKAAAAVNMRAGLFSPTASRR